MKGPADYLREKWLGWEEWEDRLILTLPREGLLHREIIFAGESARSVRAIDKRWAWLKQNHADTVEEFRIKRDEWLTDDRAAALV